MRSVADELRQRTRAQLRSLSIGDRIALALSLGDQDLHVFMRSSGLRRPEALARLRNQRRRGRRPSVADLT